MNNIASALQRSPSPQSIPQRFEEIVARQPDRMAVKFEKHSLSYRELNEASNRIAHTLLAIDHPDRAPIALLFGRGINIIVALIGAVKAGKQVYALDAQAPEERIKQILDDQGSFLIVTDDQFSAPAQRIAGNRRTVFNIHEIDASAVSTNPGVPISPKDAGSIIFTSGSTGQPRGIIRTHQGIVNTAISNGIYRNISAADRLSLLHSIHFGVGEHDLWLALLNGAAGLPFDFSSSGGFALARWLSNERVTVFSAPPALFRQLAEIDCGAADFADLRLIRLAGAPTTRNDFEIYKNKFGRGTVLELSLGTTETGSICNAMVNHEFSFPQEGSPVGYPREGREVLIRNDEGQDLGPGEVGEIVVRSRQFSLEQFGRLGVPEAKFQRDPKDENALIYCTGDLGTRLADGFVIHRGRKDLMVKIRGFRVEIGEIERALASHPLADDAAVVAWDRGADENYLVGYLVVRRRTDLTVGALRAFLASRLPDYMIPSVFVFLESLPLTNGKVDRRALPEPNHIRPQLGTPYVAPRNDLERRLVALWEKIFDVCPIGVDDDFFDLGGYSLLGSRLIAELTDNFQVDLPLPLLGEQPTIAQLAVHIARARAGQADPRKREQDYNYIVKLRSADGQTPVICLSHAGNYRGDLLRFAQLNRLIGPPYCFYGIQARGADGASQPHGSVEEMATAYVEEIERLNPQGPHYLIGECGSAPIAYETARQLQLRQGKVALLVLLDAKASDRNAAHGYFWRRYIWHRYFPWLCYPFHAVNQAQIEFKRRIDLHLPELPWLKGRQRLEYLLTTGRKSLSFSIPVMPLPA